MIEALHRGILLAACVGAAGCALPGSGMTTIQFEGSVVAADGTPLPGTRVRVVLPEGYGLRGLDAIYGSPSDYGHEDQTMVATADGEGRFDAGSATTTYTMTFWILPPIGMLFQGPPDPVVTVRVEDTEEFYAVRALPDRLEVQTFDLHDGRRLERPAFYRLSGRVEPRDLPGANGKTLKGRVVTLQIRRSPR